MILWTQCTVWGSDEKGHDTRYKQQGLIGTREELEEFHKILGEFLHNNGPKETFASNGVQLTFQLVEKPFEEL